MIDIFNIENLVILLMLIGLTVSIECMILKHEWDVEASMSKNWLFRNFFKCMLCTGLYIMMLECVVLVPFYGYDVLTLPFMGAGIVNFFIKP